jgi:hypothetical protein
MRRAIWRAFVPVGVSYRPTAVAAQLLLSSVDCLSADKAAFQFGNVAICWTTNFPGGPGGLMGSSQKN